MTNNGIWQGKVAIVTGGSSGIGQATATELVEKGASVLITGRNTVKLADFAAMSDKIEALQMDSSDVNSGAQIVEAAMSRWGVLI